MPDSTPETKTITIRALAQQQQQHQKREINTVIIVILQKAPCGVGCVRVCCASVVRFTA